MASDYFCLIKLCYESVHGEFSILTAYFTIRLQIQDQKYVSSSMSIVFKTYFTMSLRLKIHFTMGFTIDT